MAPQISHLKGFMEFLILSGLKVYKSRLSTCYMAKKEFNSDEINDGLERGLWSLFKAEPFAFYDRVPDPKKIPMDEGDFLIHKAWREGERFPSIRYHLFLSDELLEVENAIIKDHLGKLVLKYAKEKNKLPFGVVYEKDFKNGSVQLKYQPSPDQSFAIRISKETYDSEGDLSVYLKGLHAETEHPLATLGELRLFTIQPMKDSAMIRSFEIDGNVNVAEAEVVDINLRTEVFQEHEKPFYLIRVKGGFLTDGRKEGRKEPLEQLNIKISDALYDSTKLMKGEKISFKGKIAVNKKLGFLLQNIRKIEKH